MENKDIILIIIVLINIYLLYKMNKVESFTNGVTTSSAASVNQVDILNQHINNEVQRRFIQLSSQNISDSIKNLGLIAKKIQEEGNFTFPSNLNVTNDLNVRNDLTVSNDLTINGNLNLPSNNKILPQGTVVMWTRSEIPEGWVLCDGSAHLRKEFLSEVSDELPEIINIEQVRLISGVTLSKYIVTPNLGGRFVLGAGQGSVEGMTNRTLDEVGPENGIEGDEDTGVRNGGEVHKLTESQMPEHNHPYKVALGGHNNPNFKIDRSDRGLTTLKENDSPVKNTGGGEEHNNMPPYYVLIYIMKIY